MSHLFFDPSSAPAPRITVLGKGVVSAECIRRSLELLGAAVEAGGYTHVGT